MLGQSSGTRDGPNPSRKRTREQHEHSLVFRRKKGYRALGDRLIRELTTERATCGLPRMLGQSRYLLEFLPTRSNMPQGEVNQEHAEREEGASRGQR